MKNIELYIYDKDLNFKGVIDEYTSLRWRRKYFEAGEFELHLKATPDNIALFKSQHVTFLSDGTPFEYISTYYRGDQYTYSLKTIFKDN